MKKFNIVFAGTPEISVQVLKDLHASGNNIKAVLTQPDRAKGRGKKIKYSPVKEFALANDILIFQALSLKKNYQIFEQLNKLKPDFIIVVAYGMIMPKEFLKIPRYGCLNIHVSLLPRWRGAAPIQRAIQAGDKKTGICIIQMDEGLDTGDILNVLEIDINETDTSASLHNKLAELAIKPLLQTLENIHNIQAQSQIGKPTYACKITKQEGLINFNKTAWQISCHIRAFTSAPSAFFIFDNQTLKIGKFEILEQCSQVEHGTIINISTKGLDVATLDKIIRFKRLQFPSKKMLNIIDILNGNNLTKYIGHKIG